MVDAPPLPVRRLTPAGEHCFFGYYDVRACSSEGRHLCHRVGFRDRFPAPGDAAEVGLVDLALDAEPGFAPFGETLAWNFQQGSMLQWLPGSQDGCVYNVYEAGRFGAAIRDVRTGERRLLPLPVANIAPDGSAALCIDMARLYDFRPGYGYEEAPDPCANEPAPSGSGIWRMGIPSGDVRRLLSLAEAAAFVERCGWRTEDRKVVVNHLTFCPDGSRFVFLLRTFPERPGGDWETFLLSASAGGSDLRLHPVWGMASHYHWRDASTLLVWARPGPGAAGQLLLLDDRTGETRPLDDVFCADGHCSWSPDRRWVLYDGYPEGEGPRRSLILYDTATRRGATVGQFLSEHTQGEQVDLRCDLHPRWMPGGRSVTLDSIHEGYRAVYHVDLDGAMEAISR